MDVNRAVMDGASALRVSALRCCYGIAAALDREAAIFFCTLCAFLSLHPKQQIAVGREQPVAGDGHGYDHTFPLRCKAQKGMKQKPLAQQTKSVRINHYHPARFYFDLP